MYWNVYYDAVSMQIICGDVCQLLPQMYAGIAVPQVLQFLRECDAPAMQSFKLLPCGTGS